MVNIKENKTWTDELEEEITKARNSLKTEKMDMSFGELISMYENNELIISPEFQRLFRWDREKKTKFIESLLLGIPIPAIFVAEVPETGQWEVVDGLQRLSTVFSFFGILQENKEKQEQQESKNNWCLEKGKFIKSFDGKNHKNLPTKYNINIRRSSCRVEVIKWDSDVDIRYEIFHRLNSLGAPLSDQELRNCIFRPKSNKFNDLLKKLSDRQEFKDLVSPTQKQIDQLYLEELVLRYFSLLDAIDDAENKINETISSYMTNYMEHIGNDSNFNFQEKEQQFTSLINLLSQLDKQVFRGGKEDARGPFSTTLYDVIMVGISFYFEYYSQIPIDELKNKLSKITQEEGFKKCSSSNASSRSRTAQRLLFTKDFFKPDS